MCPLLVIPHAFGILITRDLSAPTVRAFLHALIFVCIPAASSFRRAISRIVDLGASGVTLRVGVVPHALRISGAIIPLSSGWVKSRTSRAAVAWLRIAIPQAQTV